MVLHKIGTVKLWEGYHTIVIDYFIGASMASYGNAVIIAQVWTPHFNVNSEKFIALVRYMYSFFQFAVLRA